MDSENKTAAARVGLHSSWSLALLTLVTWGLAMMAIPPAGPYCPANCMEYPYADLLSYYPRDYYWMYLAVFQMCVFLIFIIASHFAAPAEKKIYSFISAAFAVIAVAVLLGNYFVQFAVVPISVIKGQTEGIALLTQYNGHGIFIALEELGFTLMSVAFVFLAPIFTGRNRLEKAMRWILVLPLAANVIAFILYALQYGLDRDYRYEVAAISSNWLASIVVGILAAVFFGRLLKKAR